MNNIVIHEDQCVPVTQILVHYGYKESDVGRLPLMTLIKLINKYYHEINH